ncbi:hypothetical protein AOCH_002446 [Aspergillus ochraceoroseus]|uniref:Carrier domain-containing protein n=1 Tax=Aspergillus ochraceoroseus TaxID=138278 RepID=A0A0F8X178_9EURO|nr:hypothetical protein AOCH_002446 [Aspergillus ochraceoroseus]
MEEAFEPAVFPALPHDAYQPAATERIGVEVGLDGSTQRSVLASFLTLSWAIVLATYTDVNDVAFGLLQSPSLLDVQSFAVRIDPQQTVEAALSKVGATRTTVGASRWNHVLIVREQCSTGQEDGSSYPLQVDCVVGEKGVRLQALFDSNCIAPETMQMMLFEFRHVYGLIQQQQQQQQQHPETVLRDIQGISPEGAEQLKRWNAAARVPRESSHLAHHLIEKQCRQRPSSPAVCAWDGNLTYEELDVQASKLAARVLLPAGVGPDRFVGLVMEKSMWTTVAMLSVMKAGGGFVLLDASQPVARLSLICGKTRPQFLLASAKHVPIAEALNVPFQVVSREIMDSIEPALRPREIPVQPHNILYAGFTSGSTGEPKGFVMDHSAFSSGLDAYCQQCNLDAQSRVLQFASYAFVVSLTDQMAPLTRGACVCVPSEEQLQNNLAGAIQGLNANWAKLTPSVLRLIEPSEVSGLETLILVGEGITASELARWQGRVQLYSLYGQSENAKGTMLSSRMEPNCDTVNIGRPFAATPWIVSSQDHNVLVPVGAEGELLLEGPCLSRGYLENEEQNRITFVQDPTWLKQVHHHHHHPHGYQGPRRFLKTGDLVRYDPKDGTIRLLGRKGTRVKIRGQRIELAEIEHHLRGPFASREPPVVEAVTPSDDTNPMLVGFVPVGGDGSLFLAPNGPFRQQAQQAISQLRHALPSFMVPAALVCLGALPRTPTGKLHRRKLREEASRLTREELAAYTSDEVAHIDPATEREILLQRGCSEVLGLPPGRIGMQANFFDLGGNSLTARQLVTRARQSGWIITIADVFQQPSLAALSQCDRYSEEAEDQNHRVRNPDPFEAIRTEFLGQLPAPPWTAAQIEDVFPTIEGQSTFAAAHELDYFLFAVTGAVRPTQLHRACQTLVQHHTILRSVFTPFQGTILQVVLRQVAVEFTVEPPKDGHGQDDAVSRAQRFCAMDLKRPYRADEPRVMFKLIIQDAAPAAASGPPSVLVMRLLHAQYDALCLTTITSDLLAAYTGREDHLIRTESDFSSYVRQCFWHRTPAALAFWRDLLRDSAQPTPAPLAELPVGGGPNEEGEASAAWALVLAQETRCSDLVFGQFVNCRSFDLPGIDRLLGPCFNIIPTRARVHPHGLRTARDLLREIQLQHSRSVDFATMGWKDIAASCTQWGGSAQQGSVVMYQNFQREVESEQGGLRLRKIGQMFKIPPLKTLYVIVFPSETSLSVTLEASNAILREKEAESTLDSL